MTTIHVDEALISGITTGTDRESDDEITLNFNIMGTGDRKKALKELLSRAPSIVDGKSRRQFRLEPETDDLWRGEVVYTTSDKRNGVWSFDTTGGSLHITQSLETTKYAPDGKTAPDHKGAIGVNGDSVDGCDIVIPSLRFTETHILPVNQITRAYSKIVAGMTGTVNNATFRGYAAGEVLFRGASSEEIGVDKQEEVAIRFEFEASANIEGLSINGITVSKKGFEYLWCWYRSFEDSTAKALTRRPGGVYVEKVYQSSNFATFGIGVA